MTVSLHYEEAQEVIETGIGDYHNKTFITQ